jgi:hypothetical protein
MYHYNILSKRCILLYLFVSYLINLILLIDYEQEKGPNKFSKGFNNS